MNCGEGKRVILPGSVRDGAGRAGCRRAAVFHIRMLLSAGTLQRYSFIQLHPSQALWRWQKKNQVAVLIHRSTCSNHQLQCFPGCPPRRKHHIWKMPLTFLQGSKNKARHSYLRNGRQWCCTEPFLPSSQPWTHMRSWSKRWLLCIFLYLHGYDQLGSNSTSSFHFFLLNLSPVFFCLSSWQPTLFRVFV